MSAPSARASLSLQRRLASALTTQLAGHSIDRIWRPAEATLLLRVTGISPERLLLHVDTALPHATMTTHWPPTPASPDQTTLRLRQALEGGRFVDVTLENERWLSFRLTRGDGPRSLRVQLAGRYPNAAALDADDAEIARLMVARPPFDPDSPPLPAGPLPGEPADDDFQALLRAWAADRQAALSALEARQRLATLHKAARTHLRKLERAEAAIAADRARVDEAEDHRVYGDLLKTALHRVPRGASSIALPDHSQPGSPTVEVPLDPALDARTNLARHFRVYRRFRDAADAIDARLNEARARRQAMEALAAEIAAHAEGATAADGPEPDLAALEARLKSLGYRPPTQAKPSRAKAAPALPYRRFTATDGSLILVGRSAADNDKLTLRHGRAGDLWLHARDVPGSHVLLRPPPGREPTSEALLDAASLAAWHSQSRGEPTVEVTWTERKHVRKARGAPAGRVTLSRGRTLSVRVESTRIDRLYQSLEADDPRR
ncbi:MAG: NFACT RNA binding domain-containing protein [Myxococcota bacterium]